MQKKDQYDTEFTLKPGDDRSGNYSCACSDSAAKRGDNVIQILDIRMYLNSKHYVSATFSALILNLCHAASFLPGVVSVAGPSTVSEGDTVEFRCTLSDTLHTLGECQLIQAFLRKNRTIIQVQIFNVTKMEATFTTEDAAVRDSGYYSCLVLPSKCITEREVKHWNGSNALLLDVNSESADMKEDEN